MTKPASPSPRACQDCGAAFEAKCASFCPACRAKRYGPGPRLKYVWTEDRDQFLRERYDGKVQGRALEIARSMGFPVWTVKRRAAILGLSYAIDRRNWTEEEERFLWESAGARTAAWIAKKLGRTLTSVTLKLKRMKISPRFREGYTLRELMLCFGCGHHLIERWVREGKLRIRRRGTDRPIDAWCASDADLLAFIRDHPMEFRLDKVDQFWFMDLILSGGLVRQALAAEAAIDGEEDGEEETALRRETAAVPAHLNGRAPAVSPGAAPGAGERTEA